MECKRHTNPSLKLEIEEHTVPQISYFKYLGSIIGNGKAVRGYVDHRIQARWVKSKKTLDVISDSRVTLKLKGNFAT